MSVATRAEVQRQLALMARDDEITVKRMTPKSERKVKHIALENSPARGFQPIIGGSHYSTGAGKDGARERRSEERSVPPIILRRRGGAAL